MSNYYNIDDHAEYPFNSGRRFKNDTIHCFVTKSNKYGVSIVNGRRDVEIIIPPRYDSACYLEKADVILVASYPNSVHKASGLDYKIFDTKGNLIKEFIGIEYIYEIAGVICITKNKKKGILNKNLILSIPCDYNHIEPITDAIFSVRKYDIIATNRGESYSNIFVGIVDIDNKVISEFDFDTTVFNQIYKNSLIIESDKRYLGKPPVFSTHNIETKYTFELSYDYVLNDHEYQAKSQENPLYRTISGVSYENENNVLQYPSGDFHYVGKWGVIAPNGDEIISNKYDYVERLSSNLFKVALGLPQITSEGGNIFKKFSGFKWGVIDLNNNIILGLDYDWIDINDQMDVLITNKLGSVEWDRAHDNGWIVEGGVMKHFKL